MRKKLKNKQ